MMKIKAIAAFVNEDWKMTVNVSLTKDGVYRVQTDVTGGLSRTHFYDTLRAAMIAALDIVGA